MPADPTVPDEPQELAEMLLEVVPLVMRSIRAEMRAHRNAELSEPQFRVLSYMQLRGKASLSEIAEQMGLTPASMSTMVETMVGRSLLDRRTDTSDRRKVVIETTAIGDEAWAAAWEATCQSMASRLRKLGGSKRRELARGLRDLRLLFS